MFFRILALLPLVSLVTANSLVDRSDVVVPVCNAISNMTTTANAMQNACTAFEANSTKEMAAPIFELGVTLKVEISSGTEVCPSDVLSNGDSQLVLDALEALYASVQKLVSLIVRLARPIEAVGLKVDFCVAIEAISTSTTAFMNKVYACGADEDKGRLEDMRGGVLTLMEQAKFSYCDTVTPSGSSKISDVEI